MQLAVMDIEMSDEVLTISIVSAQACLYWLLCDTPSPRVHCPYLRQVADLPCSGKFVCMSHTALVSNRAGHWV